MAGRSHDYLGRVDHQVKLRGYRIELGEIEAVLGQHSAVRDNAVLVRDTEAGDQRLVAYVVLAQQSMQQQLRPYLREHLPEYMVPSAFVLLEEMPLTPNGKIDRNALALLTWRKTEPQEEVAVPHTPIEQMLGQMWEQVLGVSPIGVHENFFELGGHSLNATQVVTRIRQTFSVELSLRTFFEKPTVAELAEFLEQSSHLRRHLTEEPIHVVSRTAPLALSFGQQRLWFLDQWEPQSTLYTIAEAQRLTGWLDVAALEQSV